MTSIESPKLNAKCQRRPTIQMVAVLTGLASAVVMALPASAEAQVSLRLGSPMHEDSTYHQGLVLFAEELSELSAGEMSVDIFPNSQLGGIAEMLTSVEAGSLDMSLAVPAWYSSFIPSMGVFTLPYLVGSIDHLRAGLDGAFGERIGRDAEEAGFKLIGFLLMGERHIVNNTRPVSTPEDLSGLKIRVINSQVYMDAFRALGANPMAMDPSELYLALQQGVVDGFEYPLPDLIFQRMYEVADYLTLDAHAVDMFVVSMNRDRWESLSEEQQAMVQEAMQTAMAWQWEEQPKATAEALEELNGLMEVTELTPEQRAQFVEATRTIYADFEETFGQELIELAIQELGQ
jgi:TRAP-type transport system periplasmic protein